MDLQPSEIVVYERDLLFLAKILGATGIKGLGVRLVKELPRLREVKYPKKVVLNLELETKELFDVVHELKEKYPAAKFIGYCAHTDTKTLQEAKEIGIDAMPRSVFVNKLNQLF